MENQTGDAPNAQQRIIQLEEENQSLRQEMKALRSNCDAALDKLQQQVAVEKQYEESLVRFRTVFEHSKLGNKIIDSDLRILQVNPGLQVMLGYSEQELVGSRIIEYAHPESVKEWEELQENLWGKKIPSFRMEARLVKKDGSTLRCEVTSVLFADQQHTLGYTILEDTAERKILEEKLSHSESMLAQSQEAAGVGSFIADLQTGVMEVTPLLNRMLGFPKGQRFIHRAKFLAVLDDKSRQRHEQLLAQAIEQGAAYASEYKIMVQGEEKWIWEKGQVRKDGEGNLQILGMVQANDSETLQLLLAVINGSTNTVTVGKPVRDDNGHITDIRFVLFNTTAKRYMGAADHSEEMIGKTLTELFPATRHNGNLTRYIDTIENNKRYQGLEYFYPHEGMHHWFSESAYCFGEYLVVTLDDITERKVREEKLRRQEALLLESEKIANIGAFEWAEDISGGVGSPHFYQILGLEEYGPLSMDMYWRFIHPHDVPALGQYIAHWEKTKGLYQTEYRIIRTDGAIRHVWVRASLVDGKLMGALMDITERVEMEHTNKRLAIRNDELGNFVYTASHDLRAPVNNMEMLFNFLVKEIPDRQGKAELYLDLLNKSISDLKHTLDDLTTVTEIHPGEKKELVNIQELVEEVKGTLYRQIEEASAVMEVDLTIPFLTIPRKHARSLVFNLLSNALKFRSQERNLLVRISSHLKGSKVHLSIEDNGIGIRAADQPKVFMIFKRFNLSVAGRGVGMYLVKRIIDLNDGDIYLESQENVGTTFHIEFPVDQ